MLLFSGHVSQAFFKGSLATYLVIQFTRPPVEPHHQVRYNQNPYFDESPEQLLYPEATTLETLYPDKGFFEAIHSPDVISIHPIDAAEDEGSIKAGGYTFSAKASQPNRETAERLFIRCVRSAAMNLREKCVSFNQRCCFDLPRVALPMICFSVSLADRSSRHTTREQTSQHKAWSRSSSVFAIPCRISRISTSSAASEH